jgi:hypothetical protein
MMRANGRGQSALLLLDVIDLINKEQIPYAVIGALAVSFYGPVRASLDVDALISLSPHAKVLDRLKIAISEAGLKAIIKRGGGDDPLLGVMLIEDKYANQVDLILGVRGLDEAAFGRVRPGRLHGETMNIIAPEDLIAMKIFAGSAKDLDDARGIWQVSKEGIDRDLLKRLTANYGRRELKVLEDILDEV